ncbi:adenylate kinase [Paragonimus westermani]|uniref:Adenylate kinase n=1 Tax=Paragonimus westermani TaxID=34504 RepID=A0A5J4NP97_9TREM|nr:adenylate kinase [Paragonimus westermani]
MLRIIPFLNLRRFDMWKVMYLIRQSLLRSVIIDRPEDPIAYLIDYLGKEIKEGPPSSGKQTVGEMLAENLGHVVLNEKDIYSLCPSGEDATAKELALAIKARLKQPDCEKRGFILVGFPVNEQQAKAMRWEGIFPEYAIFLEAPLQTLIEREAGKRLDPLTGGKYHLISNPPPSVCVENRLVSLPDNTPEKIKFLLEAYNRETVLLQQIYASVMKTVNAAQPLSDMYASVLAHVTQPPRSLALRTPRIVLLGFAGCGKKTQAGLLANKYGLLTVNCGELIRKEIANSTLLGKAMKSYVARNMPVPDAIVAEALKERLTQADCTIRGWILYGYPRSRQQAELLDSENLAPNRVFAMEVSQVCAAERITGRRIDPVTGTRFHMAYRPTEVELSERMLQNPKDVECVIGSKLAQFAAHREDLYDYYSSKLIHVHANLDAHTVFEEIEAGLINPLPRDLS